MSDNNQGNPLKFTNSFSPEDVDCILCHLTNGICFLQKFVVPSKHF